MNDILIFKQIAILLIAALVGVLASKLKIINEEVKNSLTRIIFDITLPFLVFQSVYNIRWSSEILINSSFVLLFSFISIIGFFLFGKLSALLLRLKHSDIKVHTLHTAFGNTVLLGFPLIDSLFPNSNALLFASLFMLVSNSLVWTLGIIILTSNSQVKQKIDFKVLINSNTIAFFLGLGLALSPLKLPEIVEVPFSGLAKATIPLSMLLIGALISQINIKMIFKRWDSFVLSFNKMLLLPVFLMAIIYLFVYLTEINLDLIAVSVVIIESSVPCQVIIVVLSRKYNLNYSLATINFTVSTLLSLLTLPLILYLIRLFFSAL